MLNLFRFFTLTFLCSLSFLSCKGNIGDECIADAQCSAGQSCDLISSGGYCTVVDCREGECPESSICITFENNDSYCMANCSSQDDCRDGYYCDSSFEQGSFCRQRP